ncbi:ROK family protein [Cryptosporangium phraense]|uniref:ROK family protein n=1 Tax=Cryptosporangium phraense TaxID=2593070 RepID=A0A545AK89_9ACTN|nr:ROK family protein [Cryptosporangium phraense]TQS41165.1 ROK family protein [Cryptosporangium phraense]
MTGAVIAVDIGGTTVKAAVVDDRGRRRSRREAPSLGGDDTVAAVRSMIDGLRAEAAAAGLDVLAAGVVTPGLVDASTGRIAYASNLGWRDFDLRGALETELRLPVSVGHDVRAAGRAEAQLGAARGASDFVLLQLGTGIAAAVMTGGVLVTGAGSAAGEAGHMPVYPGGEDCPCGKRGCLEAYAAGAAVPRRYRAAGGTGASTAREVTALLGRDALADQVWTEATTALAFGLNTLTMMLDPALIVLGGGMALAGDALLKPVSAALSELLVWRAAPPLRLSSVGPAAGQLGAAIEAFALTGSAACVDEWTSGPAGCPE